MQRLRIDLSSAGRGRMVLLTVLGTLFCIAGALVLDSYSFATNSWQWGSAPMNDVVIPLVLAPPFFLYLLGKLRELAIAHGELMVVASTDPLTSCLNRRAFTAMVDGYLDRMEQKRVARQGALLIIDVDHFKSINDRFGHDGGDVALKTVASTIRGSLRDLDVFGRIGGEEFSVFLPNASRDSAETVAERIRASVCAADIELGDETCRVSVSIGGVTFDSDTSFSELYRHADQRLYLAKRGGRNRVDMHSAAAKAPVMSLH